MDRKRVELLTRIKEAAEALREVNTAHEIMALLPPQVTSICWIQGGHGPRVNYIGLEGGWSLDDADDEMVESWLKELEKQSCLPAAPRLECMRSDAEEWYKAIFSEFWPLEVGNEGYKHFTWLLGREGRESEEQWLWTRENTSRERVMRLQLQLKEAISELDEKEEEEEEKPQEKPSESNDYPRDCLLDSYLLDEEESGMDYEGNMISSFFH